MAEVVTILTKIFLTIVSLAVFILGTLVAIDPAGIGIELLEKIRGTLPSELIDQYIVMLRIVSIVASVSGFLCFVFSMYFLWRSSD